jgi:hypothetical protein
MVALGDERSFLYSSKIKLEVCNMAALTLFPLGEIVITPGATALEIDFKPYLKRHQTGDWGDISRENAEINDLCVNQKFPLASLYVVDKNCFLIVTEQDRSVTTVCLPAEF